MSETVVMPLTDFLLARIAEDEGNARFSRGGHASWCEEVSCSCGVEPARVLAECEAKRRIVALHVVGDPDEWSPELQACRLCQWDEDCDSPKHDYQHGAGRFPCDTLRALAAVYAGHPDFQEAWRP